MFKGESELEFVQTASARKRQSKAIIILVVAVILLLILNVVFIALFAVEKSKSKETEEQYRSQPVPRVCSTENCLENAQGEAGYILLVNSPQRTGCLN